MNLPLTLDPASETPLYRQLYKQIRERVLTGQLASGTRLPASRELATQLAVSRNTVTNAYEQLAAEGYLESRVGAWTFVAAQLSMDLVARPRALGQTGERLAPRLNRYAEMLKDAYRLAYAPQPAVTYDFRRFAPALDAFPVTEWRRIVARQWLAPSPSDLGYGSAQGNPLLRKEVAAYVARARAVNCTPDQIVITTGSQQAFDVLARITLEPGSAVVIEEPGYVGARAIFASHGADIVPVPVDQDGIDVAALPKGRSGRVRLVYVTPSHQFPTGVTMSLPRRLALLQWATQARALIVEDDYDSEFRYEGGTFESLQGLDTHQSVVYVGTFSKVLSPALRVGYVVLPEGLVEPFVAAKSLADRHTASFQQAALAAFMESGQFVRHLRRVTRLHRLRRDALLRALRLHFGEDVLIGEARAGLHIQVRWRSHPATDALLERAREAGIGLFRTRSLYLRTPRADPGVLMTFASMPEPKIRAGVAALAKVLA